MRSRPPPERAQRLHDDLAQRFVFVTGGVYGGALRTPIPLEALNALTRAPAS
jgi:hypothetical protein